MNFSSLSNPVFQREVRASWRRGRAFSLLFGYALLLALWTVLTLSRLPDDGSFFARGRGLFVALTTLQTLTWMLLAPALTATSLAGERERGLLEALHLTPLTGRAIVWGKIGGASLFAFLLWLVALPMLTLSFLLGGLSISQCLQSLTLQGATLLCSAAIGVCCSAWSSRAIVALRISYGVVLFWGLAGFVAMLALLWPKWHPAIHTTLLLLVQANPVMVAVSLNNPPLATALSGATLRLLPFVEISPLLVCAALQIVAACLLLRAAGFALRRPLGEATWWEIKPRARRAKNETSMATVAPESWTVRLTSFSNPVLTHETRSKLRMRRPPLAVIVFEALLAVAVLLVYGALLFAAWFMPTGSWIKGVLGSSGFELSLRETMWGVLPWVAFLVMLPAGALMGAVAIARERESGAWQGVVLSLLTPGEILRGKIGGALWTCAFFSLPLWPLLIPGVRAVEYQAFLSDPASANNGVPLTMAASTLAILTSSLFGATALGLLVSWHYQRSDAAGGWTLATLLFFLAALPLFAPKFGGLATTLWHPGFALWTVTRDYKTEALFPIVWPVCTIWLTIGIACCFVTWERLSHEIRSSSGSQSPHGAP